MRAPLHQLHAGRGDGHGGANPEVSATRTVSAFGVYTEIVGFLFENAGSAGGDDFQVTVSRAPEPATGGLGVASHIGLALWRPNLRLKVRGRWVIPGRSLPRLLEYGFELGCEGHELARRFERNDGCPPLVSREVQTRELLVRSRVGLNLSAALEGCDGKRRLARVLREGCEVHLEPWTAATERIESLQDVLSSREICACPRDMEGVSIDDTERLDSEYERSNPPGK
jgi:hypothetical protein